MAMEFSTVVGVGKTGVLAHVVAGGVTSLAGSCIGLWVAGTVDIAELGETAAGGMGNAGRTPEKTAGGVAFLSGLATDTWVGGAAEADGVKDVDGKV